MGEKLNVIYNGACPICAREIGLYRRRAERAGAAVQFTDLNDAELRQHGLDRDAAARALHVVQGDRLLNGLAAFRALWAVTPGFRWLAWVSGLPVLRQMADALYQWLLAPMLYAMHRRRLARRERQ